MKIEKGKKGEKNHKNDIEKVDIEKEKRREEGWELNRKGERTK